MDLRVNFNVGIGAILIFVLPHSVKLQLSDVVPKVELKAFLIFTLQFPYFLAGLTLSLDIDVSNRNNDRDRAITFQRHCNNIQIAPLFCNYDTVVSSVGAAQDLSRGD